LVICIDNNAIAADGFLQTLEQPWMKKTTLTLGKFTNKLPAGAETGVNAVDQSLQLRAFDSYRAFTVSASAACGPECGYRAADNPIIK
jgi:hypothetical protein